MRRIARAVVAAAAVAGSLAVASPAVAKGSDVILHGTTTYYQGGQGGLGGRFDWSGTGDLKKVGSGKWALERWFGCTFQDYEVCTEVYTFQFTNRKGTISGTVALPMGTSVPSGPPAQIPVSGAGVTGYVSLEFPTPLAVGSPVEFLGSISK